MEKTMNETEIKSTMSKISNEKFCYSRQCQRKKAAIELTSIRISTFTLALSILWLMSICNSVIEAQVQLNKQTAQGFACVRRDHQIFCPRPPTIESKSSDQNTNNSEHSKKGQPTANCRTNGKNSCKSSWKVNNEQQDHQQLPVASFYAYLPHHEHMEHNERLKSDAHEHLIIDVPHHELHPENDQLHEANIIHRVKRDDIHEFIEENKSLMRRMFGVEPPPLVDDHSIVMSRSSLYPWSTASLPASEQNKQLTRSGDQIAIRSQRSYNQQHASDSELANNHSDDNYSMQSGKHSAPDNNINVSHTSTVISNGSSNTIGMHNSSTNAGNSHHRALSKELRVKRSSRSSSWSSSSASPVGESEIGASSESIGVATKFESTSPSSSSSSSPSPMPTQQRVDSCESILEVVTPYWATNSAGKIRAVVNSQHMQQAIQQEICQSTTTQRCNGECGCEQKYKWHRLLAYDPEESCKGIFMDWFLFPSNCVCRCTVSSNGPFLAPPSAPSSGVTRQAGSARPQRATNTKPLSVQGQRRSY